MDLTITILISSFKKQSTRLPVTLECMVGLLDVEHFQGAGAHVVDGADRTTAGDGLAVTVTGSLLSDRNMCQARVSSFHYYGRVSIEGDDHGVRRRRSCGHRYLGLVLAPANVVLAVGAASSSSSRAGSAARWGGAFNISFTHQISDLRCLLHTCVQTLGGVSGSLGLEAVRVLHVTFPLVGTLVSGV